MFLTLFQRYKFLDVGLSTVIFFVLVGTILSQLKRYEDETHFQIHLTQTVLLADWKKNWNSDPGRARALAYSYARRLRPKGVPFQASGVHYFTRASQAFLYIFLPFLHNYDVKMPNFVFYGELNKQRRNFISLSELEYGPLEFKFRRIRVYLTK